MRPIPHPAIKDIKVEAILHALSDPIRVAIMFELLNCSDYQICADLLLVGETPTNKSTMSRHLKVLREAGLIYSERSGVEMHNTSRHEEIEARFPRLLTEIANAFEIQMKEKTAAKSARKAKAKR